MAAFFSQIGYKPTREWKEEMRLLGSAGLQHRRPATARRDSRHRRTAGSNGVAQLPPARPSRSSEAVFPDGTASRSRPDRDPREVFADWLITPRNPWFTRSIVNRVWAWLLGRGIIHEPDDIRDDNPPSNPALLAYLEKELIAGHYDLKRLYRLILNSKHLSAFLDARDPAIPQAEANFASYPLRRLDAEVLIDAINKITGTSDLYTSPIPEPFTYIPEDMPAVAIADGSITSPFLALFGRSARATGMENERNNKPIPPSGCTCSTRATSSASWSRARSSRRSSTAGRKPEEIVDELYLTILSRFADADENEERRRRTSESSRAQARVRGGRHPLGLDQQPRVSLPALSAGESAEDHDHESHLIRTAPDDST